MNNWTNFIAMEVGLDKDNMLETRTENDSDGNVLFLGLTNVPQASTSTPVWYILKLQYDSNGYFNYKQLPLKPGMISSGSNASFVYVWDERENYFV